MAPTLPSGTVTFLFSDIEGSTRLLQRLGPRYVEALNDHQRLLRAAWAAHNGVEVDTQGDAFFVAFSRALDAVAAAIDATQALAAHSWPDGESLVVRIGLHTGAPSIVGDKYVGLDVHRAARIASAGYGGQILLSQTTRDLCEDELPEDISLLDMGEVLLKDLLHPEHLFQVAIPDLSHDFPPLKSLDRARNNLPIQITPCLGRQEVSQRIINLLGQDDVRIVTLLGPGGIGKTRLAIDVAAQETLRFPDGVYFVPLAPLADPALVASTIARSLGLRDAGSLTAEERLHSTVGSKRMLLVADNFEHVAAAAPVIARLVAACEGVKALVTSRVPLRLRGEHEFVITPLETPAILSWGKAAKSKAAQRERELESLADYASVALFIERAREVKLDFALSMANASAVVEICRRLDGLPLAIELAAARLKLLSPQAMLTRLSKRFALLTDGPRDQPERHHTLRAAIAWSYDLLSSDEQAVFRRLAVFTGGWTLDAAEAVCSPALDALAGMSALIDQSLISQREESDGESRFSQLETIREFATDELESSGEADAVREAHARFFLALAEQTQREARGPDAQMWLARLERENDNFRAALAWLRDKGELTLGLRLANALSGFWNSHGHLREGARWLDELITRAEPHIADGGDADEALRTVYAWGLGREGALVAYLSDFARANVLLQRCLVAERALGDRERELRTLNMLGVAAQVHDDQQAAMRWYEEGVAIARSAGLEDLTTIFLNNIGDVSYYHGDYERALECYRERLGYCVRSGDQTGVAVGRQNVGRTFLRQGETERAAIELRESLSGAWRLRDPRHIAEGFEGLAALAGARGEAERAARLLGASAQLREMLGTPQPPSERADIESAVAGVRASVSDESWAAAFEGGQEQPTDQVIASELESGDVE